jgi:aryl-alcohol dehydrogenase-like predicted oxidoreductase
LATPSGDQISSQWLGASGGLERDADREHLPLAWARGQGITAYSQLGGGGLSHRLRNRCENDVLAFALADIATKLEAEFSTVALAWVQSKGMIPILGPRDEAQLAEGLVAGEMILSAEQIERLNACSEPHRMQPYEVLSQVRARISAITADMRPRTSRGAENV